MVQCEVETKNKFNYLQFYFDAVHKRTGKRKSFVRTYHYKKHKLTSISDLEKELLELATLLKKEDYETVIKH